MQVSVRAVDVARRFVVTLDGRKVSATSRKPGLWSISNIHTAVEELREGHRENEEGQKIASATKRGQARRRRPAKKRTKKDSGQSDTPQSGTEGEKKRQRARSSRTGPRSALRQLAEGEFFKNPRSIGDIQKHLETRRALRFKLQDLSPHLGFLVREGLLDREKNEKKVYEYKLADGE